MPTTVGIVSTDWEIPTSLRVICTARVFYFFFFVVTARTGRAYLILFIFCSAVIFYTRRGLARVKVVIVVCTGRATARGETHIFISVFFFFNILFYFLPDAPVYLRVCYACVRRLSKRTNSSCVGGRGREYIKK